MRTMILVLALMVFPRLLQAQTDSVTVLHAFAITDYMKPINDSITVVQVQLPDGSPILITEKQLGLLKHRYENGKPLDTAMMGYGRCNLIKGDYYYFSLKLTKGQQPVAGDLLYTRVKLPAGYQGLLFKLATHAIQLQQVDESLPYHKEQTVYFKNEADEVVVLDSLVSDIHYTGQVMAEQMPESNQTIVGGIFDGKKLFAAMQTATRKHLEDFLNYMIARPAKYAGHKWKIAEIFATWMVSETPVVR